MNGTFNGSNRDRCAVYTISPRQQRTTDINQPSGETAEFKVFDSTNPTSPVRQGIVTRSASFGPLVDRRCRHVQITLVAGDEQTASSSLSRSYLKTPNSFRIKYTNQTSEITQCYLLNINNDAVCRRASDA